MNTSHIALIRRGVSVAAMMAALSVPPALAQTASMLRGAAGLTTPVVNAPAVLPQAVTPNLAGLGSASARAIAEQARVASTVSLAQQAQAALRSAAPSMVIPNGLVAGGLIPVANPTTAALDPTGLNTWQGASQPVASGSTVTITQQTARALLSWQSFNVGRETTLAFVQQPDYVVVNRIVGNIDPLTGRLAGGTLAPSMILGQITAAGTVVVINQNGIMFGSSGQVNTRSLLTSSLELGSISRGIDTAATATTLADRNTSFLQSGLLNANGGLVSTVGTQSIAGQTIFDTATIEGDVRVAGGAQITAGDGGFVIIAAPHIVNAGTLSASNGQVGLVSGRRVDALPSSGSSDSLDPNVRGLVLTGRSRAGFLVPLDQRSDSVENAAGAIVASSRGLISLTSTELGSVAQNGILTSTTSVSRNGNVSLRGATVSLGAGSVIAITPDTNGETIPQAPDSVAAFKRSVINIGGATPTSDAAPTIGVTPAIIDIGNNALIYAPGAVASIGGTSDASTTDLDQVVTAQASRVTVGDNAVIDVGGVKDVQLPASRNSIRISPVKRNELRDTPNYREVVTDGSFTLNGTTLFVDPRLSGVRADGVAWVGSPLIEAGSYFGQIGVTAAELLTRGGTLTLATRSFVQGGPEALIGTVTVRPSATLDISGGWVSYAPGVVQTSRLLTADGRIVEIGRADPNDNFVGIVDPITVTQDRFGLTQSFGNPLAQEFGFEPGYIEGRDAGALIVKASTNVFGGSIFAQAFAGTQQIARAREASVAPVVRGDTRRLQSDSFELPSGGLFKVQAIGATTGGADIVVTDAAVPVRSASEIVLSDTLLSGSGLSAVVLQTSGGIDFRKGTTVALAPNGGLVADAGRGIRFDGNILAPSGTIAARTYEVLSGSVFSTADDLPLSLAADVATPRLFDIDVSGTLSARGVLTVNPRASTRSRSSLV